LKDIFTDFSGYFCDVFHTISTESPQKVHGNSEADIDLILDWQAIEAGFSV
jgi:hypothetical protein